MGGGCLGNGGYLYIRISGYFKEPIIGCSNLQFDKEYKEYQILCITNMSV